MSNTDFEGPDDAELPEDVETPDEGVVEDGEEADDEVPATDQEEGGEEEVAQPRRSRANDTIRELRSRAQTEKERADRIEREVQDIRAQQQRAQQQPQISQEQEAERLALMTPEERSDYKVNKALEGHRREMAATQFRMEDNADKLAFQAKAAADKVYAKYAQKVEDQRIALLRQGQVIPREELFYWMLGKDALAARTKAGAKQARTGQENIRRQTTQVANGRADTQTNRRQVSDSPRKRLEGVSI